MTSDTYDIPHPDRGEPNNHLDTRGHPDRDLLGEVIGSVVHDLHNLLQRITNALEIELHSDAPVTRERVHANGIQAVEQARRLAQRLLEVGRDSPAMWRPLLPGVLIGRLAPLLRAMLGERIRFELVLEPPRWRAMMPSARFEAAILNLVANARDTITGHGRVRLSLKHIASGQRPAGLPDRDWIRISIDSDRYGSGQPAGRQVARALGLASIRRFVDAMHGALSGECSLLTGMSLFLPAAPADADGADMRLRPSGRLQTLQPTPSSALVVVTNGDSLGTSRDQVLVGAEMLEHWLPEALALAAGMRPARFLPRQRSLAPPVLTAWPWSDPIRDFVEGWCAHCRLCARLIGPSQIMHNKHRGHLFAWRLSGTASAPVFTPESGTSRSASQATKASCWRDPADESRGMLALLGRAYPQARIGVPFLERQTRADTAGESALEYAVVPASDDGQSITHLVCRMNTIGEHCQSSQGQPTE